MRRTLLFSILMLLLTTATVAKEQSDTAFNNLYRRYFQLYTENNESLFYAAGEKMKEHYLENKDYDSYYKIALNEILFDTEQGKTYRAIKKSSSLLQEMNQNGKNYYHIVYSALGTIYDMRGNYRMANKYYEDALKACEPTDSGSLISIYSRIAALKAHREPQKALEVNELFGKMAVDGFPQYYKIYTVLKAEIAFYLHNRRLFEEAYRQYQQVRKENPLLDDYGKEVMAMAKATFDGHYSQALAILQHESPDFTTLDRSDMRVNIYEMMGNKERAIKEIERRRDLRDSLNSDMIFESINEINAQMGMLKIQEEAQAEREKANKQLRVFMAVIILLLLIALALTISYLLTRRRLQEKLIKKNQELVIALSHAEEADRMKDSFIQHVSHEIRTPLNVVTGFAQIISNDEYKLDDERRSHMLKEISKNTQEITYIVNELLEVAENESREYYPREDTLPVNYFFNKILKDGERYNNNHLTLKYSTQVDNSFSIKTNRRVLEKIVIQLMINALKFTKEGSVTMDIRLSSFQNILYVTITDTGIGIPVEYRERIFERFFKVDNFKPGFGLGLTISRKLANLLGGSLVLDKDYTCGASFILSLPTEQRTTLLP